MAVARERLAAIFTEMLSTMDDEKLEQIAQSLLAFAESKSYLVVDLERVAPLILALYEYGAVEEGWDAADYQTMISGMQLVEVDGISDDGGRTFARAGDVGRKKYILFEVGE